MGRAAHPPRHASAPAGTISGTPSRSTARYARGAEEGDPGRRPRERRSHAALSAYLAEISRPGELRGIHQTSDFCDSLWFIYDINYM